jgi:hypothetical protein
MKIREDKIIIAEGLGFFGYFLGGFLLFIGIILFLIETYAIGTAFLIPGLLLATFRQRLTIDKNLGFMTKRWGLFAAYIISKKILIKDAKAVVVFREVSSSTVQTYRKSRTYYIEIETLDKKIELWSYPIDDDAYKTAEKIAKFLNLSRYTRTNE